MFSALFILFSLAVLDIWYICKVDPEGLNILTVKTGEKKTSKNNQNKPNNRKTNQTNHSHPKVHRNCSGLEEIFLFLLK